MKKIVIVTDAWHPQVNGVVTVFAALCPLLEKLGFSVSVIHPRLFRTVPMPFYPEIRLALFPRRHVGEILRELQPDAVHIATEGPLGWAARGEALVHGIPFTTSYHTQFQLHIEARVGGPFLTPLVYTFLRIFHGKAVRTMVATESLKSTLEENGFKNLILWPFGVDTELFVRNPSPPLPEFPKPVFVYFGRVATEKNIEEFLEAKLPGTKLVIGDGPSRSQLEKKYAGQARFLGYKRGQELVDWLSLSDVFVFPSRTETFGLVILEALACGVPVAAHDAIGPRDILTNGKDGIMGKDLAEAAQKALTLNRADCRATAEAYSWKHSAEVFSRNLTFI